MKLFLIFLFILIFKILPFHEYFLLTCSILTLLLIRSLPKKTISIALYLLLSIIFPFKLVFSTARTFMVANLASILFIIGSILCILRLKKIYKVVILFIAIMIVCFCVINIANNDNLRSLIGIDELIARGNEMEAQLLKREKDFIPQKLEIKLYNPYTGNDRKNLTSSFAFLQKNAIVSKKSKLQLQAKRTAHLQILSIVNDKQPVPISDGLVPTEVASQSDVKVSSTKDIEKPILPANSLPSPEINKARSMEICYANSLFRIFIWQDALNDIMKYKPIFGFDFGKPFRSRTLEILVWAENDWGRDGWVCFHNGYLDIIYRSGILSIVFFSFIFAMLFIMIRKSFQIKSLNGILLMSALINWFVAANFLEILEMPYTAIPLWSLFGVTWAYLFKNKTS
ncbi:MAG: O-antigen ligase family protein [Candidatus Omnitrophica bacterium]|nr:O-antigen ligase family protein [Candidatus Omnitrophota bacterium]